LPWDQFWLRICDVLGDARKAVLLQAMRRLSREEVR